MKLKVYSMPRCIKCDQTYKALEAACVEFDKIDISIDASAYEFVESFNVRELPFVYKNEKTFWNGFRPDLIKEL